VNKAQYITSYVGRMKLKVKVVPTLKGDKSEPQSISKNVSDLVLASGV